MYKIEDISHIHLEISSRCNASCPLCPRNFYGYPFNDGYIERDLTLSEVKKIFSPVFIKQLHTLYVNGNFGDLVMNPESEEIIEYFRACSDKIEILISTNGGARNEKFWKKLAELKTKIYFCIDGLEDTHSLYRQNTLYSTVIKNAKTFIDNGGYAIWKMISFDHNKHQHNQAKLLSKNFGFRQFLIINDGRNTAPVFTTDGRLSHVIGNPVETDFKKLYTIRTTDDVLLEDITPGKKVSPIKCYVKQQKSIYVSSTGDVYPCCYLGFSPKSYGHGNYHQATNFQFSDWIQENNALTYSLEHCIQWFSKIEKSWNIDSFEKGRLVICNDVCGVK